ncbi:protein piccolo-like [Leopardus geoffroyi]|uniref:protein piccolo-like n=1 Tax=Leopardus geoffroyi TaxID=46844 RepID=UPI001E264215|nr:protein piccolo-like [Leopardus geoffroyi]
MANRDPIQGPSQEGWSVRPWLGWNVLVLFSSQWRAGPGSAQAAKSQVERPQPLPQDPPPPHIRGPTESPSSPSGTPRACGPRLAHCSERLCTHGGSTVLPKVSAEPGACVFQFGLIRPQVFEVQGFEGRRRKVRRPETLWGTGGTRGAPEGSPKSPPGWVPGPPAGLTLPHPCRGLAGRNTASGGPSRDPQTSLSGHWWDIIGVGTVRLLGAEPRPLVPSDPPLSERLREKPSPPRPSPQGALGILLRPWELLPDQPWATCTRLPPPTMNGASRGLSLPRPSPSRPPALPLCRGGHLGLKE